MLSCTKQINMQINLYIQLTTNKTREGKEIKDTSRSQASNKQMDIHVQAAMCVRYGLMDDVDMHKMAL